MSQAVVVRSSALVAQRHGDPQSRRAWGTMCGGGLQGQSWAVAVWSLHKC